MQKQDLARYWKKNLRMMAILLSVWFLVSYVFGIFAVQAMNKIHIGGFPLGFWFAQQGSEFIFVVLIFIYYFYMRKLDREFDVQE